MGFGEHLGLVPRPVNKTGLTLLVPGEHAPALQCTVPVTLDDVCGATFSRHERSSYEAHVLKCIKQHEDVIRAASPSVRRDVLHGIFDKDLEKYLEENREAIIEGRKTL
jgi:hypothetical protein